MMIQTIKVDNFRCFKSLEVSGLRRVNIIVGRNGSGKTALLESIKIGLDGLPQTVTWLNQLRNIPAVLPPNATPEQFQSLFSDFFYDFHQQEPISIWVRDSDGRDASLRISFDPKKAVTAQQGLGFQPGQTLPPVTVIPLVFNRSDFQKQKTTLSATINRHGQLFLEPGKPMGIVSGLISSGYFGGPGENAQWLSFLSVQKRSQEVIEALQRHFPAIVGVTSETLFPGLATVYADILGVSRKLPLSLVSTGISRLFTLILAVVNYGQGVVLVDEVENGIFHDQHQKLWNTLADLARRHDTQLFVTTHSRECLKASVSAIEEAPDDFSLLRMRRHEGESDVELFVGEQVAAALDKNGEVRD